MPYSEQRNQSSPGIEECALNTAVIHSSRKLSPKSKSFCAKSPPGLCHPARIPAQTSPVLHCAPQDTHPYHVDRRVYHISHSEVKHLMLGKRTNTGSFPHRPDIVHKAAPLVQGAPALLTGNAEPGYGGASDCSWSSSDQDNQWALQPRSINWATCMDGNRALPLRQMQLNS